MTKNEQIDGHKRKFLKFSSLIPLIPALSAVTHHSRQSIYLEDEFLVVNGWVLLKSDLTES